MPLPLETLAFLALGAVLGVVGGLFGIGGGIVAIPVLVLGFGFDEQHAQGTALAMIVPNLLLGLWGYARRPGFDRRAALVLAAFGLPTTFLGALLAVHVSGTALRLAFATFLAVFAVWSIARTMLMRPGPTPPARFGRGGIAVVGAAGGVLQGIFSIGAAGFAVPALTLLFGFSQVAAQGVVLGLIAPATAVTILVYAHAHDVVWRVGIPLAAGGALCVRYGVDLAHRLPERTLRLLFCLLLGSVSLALFSK